MTRTTRTAAAMVALLLGMLALSASPIAAQDSTPAASPGADPPVVVGETEVTWTGDWEFDPDSSAEDQIVLSQVDPATATIMIATYGELADETMDNPETALDTFAASFFEGAGSEGVEVAAGELDNGAVWKAFAFDLQGIELNLVITVSEIAEGEFVVTTLTGTIAGFQQSIESAQADIMLNGQPLFLDGVDAEAVASGMEARLEATPST